jgi:flagellar hook-associated protein 1 FlgK
MSNLLSLMNTGAAAITTQNAGIAVAADNVANVNTEGRTRQRVDMEQVSGLGMFGGSVRAVGPQRYADDLLAGSIRSTAGSLSMSRAFAAALDVPLSELSSGKTIDQALSDLYAQFQQLSASPTDTVSREATIAAARALAEGIQRRAEAVDAAFAAAQERIEANTSDVTSLAKQIAAANAAVAKSGDPIAADKRDLAARKLAELVGGQARIDPDGQMRFTLDNGAVLVDGQRAAKMTTTPTAAGSRIEIVDGANRRDVTASLTGGKLGGEVAARDQALAGARDQLDQLAFDVATNVNGIHRAHAALDGTTGRDLFVQPGAVAGAAKALAINTAIEDDPALLAVGTVGAGPGDNAGAIAMVGLSAQGVAAGGRTLGDAALDVIGKLATASSEATTDADTSEVLASHLDGLRDSISGVDSDEELASLSQFENVSRALMRFVSTCDSLLGTLIESL